MPCTNDDTRERRETLAEYFDRTKAQHERSLRKLGHQNYQPTPPPDSNTKRPK